MQNDVSKSSLYQSANVINIDLVKHCLNNLIGYKNKHN